MRAADEDVCSVCVQQQWPSSTSSSRVSNSTGMRVHASGGQASKYSVEA
jgi:hypothetical protein